jgi:hypothetical protein
MSSRIFPIGDPVHRTTLDLLPWYANGTLEGEERARVEEHLSACLPCRRELEAQRALQSALSQLPPDPELDKALARMHARLDATQRGSLHALMRHLWHGSHPWLRGALALQLVLIVSLAAVVGLRPAAQYHTLSSSASDSGQPTGIAVMFSPGRSEQEVRALLTRLSLRIVDGPSEAGAYTLAAEAQRRDAAIAALRADPAVKLALPISLSDQGTR